ncbi:MAG: prepilin-type N-terminal cleavage/methylation domain-containing protein [Planctomycetota bacterium]
MFINKRHNSSEESGFTLLELLVALTLAAIISLIIAQVGTDSQNMYDSTITTVETYQKFRYALDDINENLSKMVPTASMEFYQDQGRSKGYWDEGEELKDQDVGPNLEGGIPGKYDEAAVLFERNYLVQDPRPGDPGEYSNDSIYFKAPIEVDGVVRLANVEYFLADPNRLEAGINDGKIPAEEELEYEDSRSLVLLKAVRYVDLDGSNYNTTEVRVRKVISELCSNVTDLKIEYFYDNQFDSKPGGFMSPSVERSPALVDSEDDQIRNEAGTFTKKFLYGGFTSRKRTNAIRGTRNVETGASMPVQFNYSGSNKIKFSQLRTGDKLYIWSDGGSSFPSGEFTMLYNSEGRLLMKEAIPSSTWDQDPGGLRFRAPFVPPSFRISVRVLNEKGDEPRTLTMVVRTNG